METRKWTVLAALFFPYTIATVAAGFLALVMIILKLDLPIIAAAVLWFYFASTASIYVVTKDALRALGVRRFFLGFTVTLGVLAALSAAVLALHA